MRASRVALLAALGLVLAAGAGVAPAAAQTFAQYRPSADNVPGQMAPDDDVDEPDAAPPPRDDRPPGPPRGERELRGERDFRGERGGRWEGLRARMFELRGLCEAGDRRACVRLGILIGENRERRAQWRRESPELFWWER